MKILYNVTYKLPNGMRTLFGAAQGRNMKSTREEAEQFLRDMMETNGEERLLEIVGVQARGIWRVDPFECYDHGDPKGIYVDD